MAGLLAPLLAHAGPVLTLSPTTGSISSLPGGVVGWGFTISNPDPNYLVVTSAQFCITVEVAGFVGCDQYPDPGLGTFTDHIAQFNFIVAGPAPESSVVSQAFSSDLLTGIGSFAIDAGAALDSSFAGQILLTYDLYSRSPNDPLFDPGFDLISPGNTLTANAAVTAIPEPATFLLVAAGAVVLLRRSRR